ncbi:hypothetical protein HGRIS_006762 [Hohenbuehelia grisea]|uniref:Uncharacterized protein n=1 Tax=Hohenbuehelia grisea TaxID=104357 RepID=A0ABR3JA17_9AGAR
MPADDHRVAGSSTMSKARKTKHYVLDKADALQIAASIGATQEEKAREKVKKSHKNAQSQPGLPRRISSSKAKLEEAKASIASERARLKKQKLKQRKQNKSPRQSDSTSHTSVPAKKVSFA